MEVSFHYQLIRIMIRHVGLDIFSIAEKYFIQVTMKCQMESLRASRKKSLLFRSLLLLTLVLSIHVACLAQWKCTFNDPESNLVLMEGDSLNLVQKIRKYHIDLIGQGYINANIDEIVVDSPYLRPTFYFGHRYDKIEVNIDEETSLLINQSARGLRAWRNLELDENEIADAIEGVMTYLENNGYPFAKINLDDLEVDTNKVAAQLKVDKGPWIRFDSLDIGDSKMVNLGFLYRYLQIEPKASYNQSLILDLKRKIDNLPFLQLKEDPSITFLNNEAIIRLPIQEQKASRFDFIFGIVPDDNSGANQGYTLTGEVLSEMINRLGAGERIFVNVRRLRPEVLDVKLSFDYPYIFGQALGVKTDFQLFRNSTNFLDVLGKAGLQFILSPNDQITFTASNKTSRLIEVDSNSILNSRRLPTQQDVSFTSGGLGLTMNHLDYRFNPTRGWAIVAEVNLGAKTIIKNRTIESLSNEFVDFENAYDTLDLTTFQSEITLLAEFYVPPTQWSTIKWSIDAAYKFNQDQLFTNELWRIGGNKRLRGFEEESIFTDRFIINTAEFRILLDKNSFLSLPIIDWALYKPQQEGFGNWDSALSVGMGLNFATQAGVFNISFVAGSRLDNPINFQETKIHFGYVNLF